MTIYYLTLHTFPVLRSHSDIVCLMKLISLLSIPFDFNLYSSLLLPFVLHGIVYCVLLFVKGKMKEDVSYTVFGFILLINSLKIAYWMLGFAGWFDLHNAYTSFMFYFPFNNMVLVGPLLYFYFRSLTNHSFRFSAAHWPHAIIPAAWLLLIAGKFLGDFLLHKPFDAGSAGQYGTKGVLAEWDKLPPARLAGYIVFFYYTWLTLREYTAYQTYLRFNFSNFAGIGFSWFRNLLIAISAGCVIMFVFEVTEFFTGGMSYRSEWYSYFLLGIVTWYLAIRGYIVNDKHRQLAFEAPEVIKEEAAIPAESSAGEKLLVFIHEQRPFLNAELTLTDLARLLRTNPSALSKTINEQLGLSFNDLVNRHRIDEVTARMRQGDHLGQTLESIAFESGFNSKSTFNRAFKKFRHMTPVEYLKTVNKPI